MAQDVQDRRGVGQASGELAPALMVQVPRPLREAAVRYARAMATASDQVIPRTEGLRQLVRVAIAAVRNGGVLKPMPDDLYDRTPRILLRVFQSDMDWIRERCHAEAVAYSEMIRNLVWTGAELQRQDGGTKRAKAR